MIIMQTELLPSISNENLVFYLFILNTVTTVFITIYNSKTDTVKKLVTQIVNTNESLINDIKNELIIFNKKFSTLIDILKRKL